MQTTKLCADANGRGGAAGGARSGGAHGGGKPDDEETGCKRGCEAATQPGEEGYDACCLTVPLHLDGGMEFASGTGSSVFLWRFGSGHGAERICALGRFGRFGACIIIALLGVARGGRNGGSRSCEIHFEKQIISAVIHFLSHSYLSPCRDSARHHVAIKLGDNL